MRITSRQKARDSVNRNKVVKSCDVVLNSAKSTPLKVLADLTNSQMKKSTPKNKKTIEKGAVDEIANVSTMTTRRASKRTEPACELTVNLRTRSSKSAAKEVTTGSSATNKSVKSPMKVKPSPAVKKKVPAKKKDTSEIKTIKESSVLSNSENGQADKSPSPKKAAKKSSPVKKMTRSNAATSKKLPLKSKENKSFLETSLKESSVLSTATDDENKKSVANKTPKKATPKKKSVVKTRAATKKKPDPVNEKEIPPIVTPSKATSKVVTPRSARNAKGSAKKTPSQTSKKQANSIEKYLDRSVKTPNSGNLNASRTKTPAKSPASAKSKTPVKKKLPIWKQLEEQKKDTNEEFDNIYDFVPDGSEPKKSKKKRAPRKPKGVSNYKPSRKVRVGKKQDDLILPPIVLELPPSLLAMESQRPKTPIQPELPSYSEDPYEVDPVQEPLVEDHQPMTTENTESLSGADVEVEQSNVEEKSQPSQEIVPPASILSEWDAEDQPMEDSAPETIWPASAGTFLSPRPEITTKDCGRSTLALENCFGFDTSLRENSVVSSSYVESTPLKPGLHQKPQKNDLTGVSPVKKVWRKPRVPLKEKPAPARLENVLQVVPRAANVTQKKPKDKQTTLLDFIQATESSKDIAVLAEEEENKAPPTPPSAFSAPARRSYSKGCLRAVKRQMFQDYEEEESEKEEEEAECEDRRPAKTRKKATYGKPDSRKKTKQETELDRWAKVMSSHFEDIENFHLSFD